MHVNIKHVRAALAELDREELELHWLCHYTGLYSVFNHWSAKMGGVLEAPVPNGMTAEEVHRMLEINGKIGERVRELHKNEAEGN